MSRPAARLRRAPRRRSRSAARFWGIRRLGPGWASFSCCGWSSLVFCACRARLSGDPV